MNEPTEREIEIVTGLMNVVATAMARAVEDAVGDASETSETPEGDGWVSVEDRLPERSRRVLSVDSTGDCAVGHFNADDLFVIKHNPVTWTSPTHWRPLPEPPK